ncbi:YdeI/OmpD-associated family protein [Costertonia aggregata]|uniref:YdeI/OmpD-associated family protein n=1 Tax=Costertonia aggregata TaxID=343403 RepID=A0A7H9AKJ6_9FLAO|nr:YdeI/OmpD-associated family protein [Costertonia aggregata]QLG43996.1 YdeI/OmpD-associated family protein [Costertonia aggregata]
MKSPAFEISITGSYYSLLLPEKIVKPFLEKKLKRVKAKASFQGKELEFHAAIQKRNGQHYMMFGKRYQKELGIFPNDYFKLQFFEDTSKYGVEMPEELDAVLLSDYDAHEIFESFTDGKKRGLIYAISRYKNSQTRIDKSLILCENLKRGLRDNRILLKSD